MIGRLEGNRRATWPERRLWEQPEATVDADQASQDESTFVLEDVRWSEGQWHRFLEILFGSAEAPEDADDAAE